MRNDQNEQTGLSAEELAMAAGICGDLEATAHVFDTRVAGARKNLIKQDPIGDCDPDNLMEHLPWLVHQKARQMVRTGTLPGVESAFLAASAELLRSGPKDFSQLPKQLSDHGRARLAAGENVHPVLEAEWREQVRALFDNAWKPWLAALRAREAVRHPLVRVAIARRASPSLSEGESLVRLDPVVVKGHDQWVAVSALVHPAEAEVLLHEYGYSGNIRLLPSPGVTQDRISTALRLRPAREKRSDPPMRSLAAALVAAAAVHGEPVFGAPYEPTPDQVGEWLTAMIPAAPKPKPTTRTSAPQWKNARFAIAA